MRPLLAPVGVNTHCCISQANCFTISEFLSDSAAIYGQALCYHSPQVRLRVPVRKGVGGSNKGVMVRKEREKERRTER